MEQRRLRPGDVVDDYCPRERRLTDHAIVALIDDTIKQVRCVSCEAEHEYKEARVPAQRRRKPGDALHAADAAAVTRSHDEDDSEPDEETVHPPSAALPHLVAPAEPPPAPVEPEPVEATAADRDEPDEDSGESALPMIARRRGDALSRHALRPPGERREGEPDPMRPVRQMPDFTVRQPGARPGGGPGRGRRRGGQGGQGHGQGGPHVGPMRSGQGSHGQGGHRQGQGQGQGQGPGQGNRAGRGSPHGGRGGRPGGGGFVQGEGRPSGGGRNRGRGRGRGQKG